jgi:flagellar hook-associated protein 1 FlgK
VGANTSGESDSRNALLLSGLQTKNTLEGGTTTYQGAYSRLVSQIGSKAQEIDVIGKAQANQVTQAQVAQQSVSGVNLDEEAANLMRYQQAYQAAGKMIQVASVMFTALIGSLS